MLVLRSSDWFLPMFSPSVTYISFMARCSTDLWKQISRPLAQYLLNWKAVDAMWQSTDNALDSRSGSLNPDQFPNIKKLHVIACIGSAERSLSALRRNETFLRSTMSEKRLPPPECRHKNRRCRFMWTSQCGTSQYDVSVFCWGGDKLNINWN